MAQKTGSAGLDHREIQGIPIFGIHGYFEEDQALELVAEVEKLLRKEKTSFIFDFSTCAAINSLAVGQLQSLTMKIVDDFQGTLVLSGVTTTMVRVFELALILPYAFQAPGIDEAVERIRTAG